MDLFMDRNLLLLIVVYFEDHLVNKILYKFKRVPVIPHGTVYTVVEYRLPTTGPANHVYRTLQRD